MQRSRSTEGCFRCFLGAISANADAASIFSEAGAESGSGVVGTSSELVCRFDQLRSERDYQRSHLQGTSLQKMRISAKVDEIADAFFESSFDKSKSQLIKKLHAWISHPSTSKVAAVAEPFLGLLVGVREVAPIEVLQRVMKACRIDQEECGPAPGQVVRSC